MVIVGDTLDGLMKQFQIVDNELCFDSFSITLHLDPQIVRIEPSSSEAVTYGESIPKTWIKKRDMPATGEVLPPHTCMLGCSKEIVRIPDGYMGFVQTKGSLARLFVSVQCSDAQIEPGFSGKVTFEICNHAAFPVRLKPGNPVAQLFIFKTSTKSGPLYKGRYQNATEPTIQKEMGIP